MIEVRVLGNEETAGWLRRKEKSLYAAGLSCDLINMDKELRLTGRPDIWLVDSDACGSKTLAEVLDEVCSTGESCVAPVVVTGKSLSPRQAIEAVYSGARRFLDKPLTPRTLANVCRDLGISDILTSRTVVVFEDRDDIFGKICRSLAARSIKALQARCIEEILDLLRNNESDAIVLSHGEGSFSLQEISSLLGFFPESTGIPVIFAKGSATDMGQRGCLGQSILEQAAQRGGRRISGGRVYDMLYELQQEHFALNQHAIVSTTDRTGQITEVNRRFCDVSQYSETELLGQNHRILKSDVHSPEFYRNLWKTISGGDVWQGEICNQARDGTHYWVSSTIVPFLDSRKRPYKYIAIRKDITHLKTSEYQVSQQTRMLNMLHDSLTAFILEGKFRATLDAMLQGLLDLTDSEFGFMAEVLFDGEQNPFLRIQSITDTSWDAFLRETYGQAGTDSLELHQMDNLLGTSIRERRIIQADETESSDSFSRLPEGHPWIRTFLSVPVFVGSDIVGVFALANRQSGYDEALIDFLRPFAATYGVIINSQRMLDMEEINRRSLVQAKSRADQANRAKSEFLSSMSHELRTPLNAILGFGQLLEDDSGLNADQQDSITEILAASKHLLALINEVLDLARVESGRLELSLEAIPVRDIVDEALTFVRLSAEKRNIQINIGDMNNLQVAADWTRLKQALLNLLSNAVKYNQVNGTILVEAHPYDDSWVEIRVTDTGAGIPESRIPELFQPFNRLGAELSHIEGTGIGLSLTQRLVELMGGSLGVRSAVNEGSTFWIRLPVELRDINTNGEPSFQSDPGEPAGHDQPGNRALTILYIEDNPANLKLVKRIIHREPRFSLLSASSGKEGLRVAGNCVPDLVLLDINLPDTDGYSVLQALKEQPGFEKLPVVALTASAMHSEVRRGKNAGFDDYLTKPIDIQELMGTLEKHLG